MAERFHAQISRFIQLSYVSSQMSKQLLTSFAIQVIEEKLIRKQRQLFFPQTDALHQSRNPLIKCNRQISVQLLQSIKPKQFKNNGILRTVCILSNTNVTRSPFYLSRMGSGPKVIPTY